MRLQRAGWISNVLILLGLFLLWSWAAQSFSSARRLTLDALIFLGVFLFVTLILRLHRRAGRRWLPAVVAAVGAWLALSALEPVMERPLSRDPSRFLRMPRVTAERALSGPAPWPVTSVGVALSGGGYRAAAYHAGVLDALDRLGVPVTNVSTVSGGSIIGTYYALGGEPPLFRDALAQGTFNLRRQLALAQNLLRLPFPGFDRGTAQANLLRQRLTLDNVEHLRSTCKSCPRLVLGATDLNFGMQVGFLDQGGLLLAYETFDWNQHHPEATGIEELDLATRVAISGAFPGAFPRRRIEIETRRQATGSYESQAKTIRRMFVLSDGGISDNTGLVLLRAAQSQSRQSPTSLTDWNVDFIVVSDASAIFGLGGDPGALASLQRAVDVLSARGSQGYHKREMQNRDLVWLTPQNNFLPIPRLFGAPHQELTPAALLAAEQSTWFNPFAFPNSILSALGEVFLDKEEPLRGDLAAFLEKRNALLPYPATDRPKEIRAISFLISRSQSREECSTKAPRARGLKTVPSCRPWLVTPCPSAWPSARNSGA